MSDLQSWLARLEQLHPTEIELGLERVSAVARALDVQTPARRVITVGGTNGKGSCVRTMEALLCAGNHSVGAYSSPHLLRFNERIRVNGEEVGDAQLIEAFEAVDAARGDISLTYFEFTTLAGLWLFKRADVEFALLEVGLGGRLDAVNLVDADISVITSVAVDHEAWLGNDREVIGREKAGILRAGKTFVCADPQPPASVVDASRELGCDSFFIGHQFSLIEGEYLLNAEPELRIGLPELHLPPSSVAAAITALALAGELPGAEQVCDVLAALQMPGRCQAIRYKEREVLLDVGHNPAAAEYLARWLARHPVAGRTVALVAVMADKDLDGLVAPLKGLVDYWYPALLPDNPRAADSEQVRAGLAAAGVAVGQVEEVGKPVAEQLELAVAALGGEDRLLVFGSFFTVAEVLSAIQPLK
ncbi:bifunctional tetrahydrofolate synthase/dihydrofolate synthase [Microbulbifer agarilyticus]|uniref:Dihydrofolate synthase/folylpolyglutamate synthase n=1 Tax=Microbulbifer agarilyticus TaxID=260552 RepID=A0A1Q2M6D4_9GAMM|nr:bifunctional tetrahydrofolate synthase/dihydrofolate synthase [Microbulbifer agarilyticus]AQQ68209.1 bifunctional tetrahydrofolate synthase/dihydrofolate synthase [Microbulbifer agarilyticus]